MAIEVPNTGIRIGLGFARCDAVVNTVPPSISGLTNLGDLLTTTDGEWTGPAISYTYQWTRDGVDILGATANTHTIVLADLGTDLNCAVTAANACGDISAAVFSLTAIAIPGCPPVLNTVAPVLSAVGVTIPGNSLVISSNGSWSQPIVSYTYVWKRDGVVIAGEVANAYTLLAGDVGKTITAFVIASSACGNSALTATNPAGFAVCANVVNTLAPVLTQSGGSPIPGSILTITTNGTWTGSPSGFAYSWKRDGVTIIGENANTYTLLAGDVGKTITGFVTANNACTAAISPTNPTGFLVVSAALPPCANCTGIQTNGVIITGPAPGGGLCSPDARHSYCFEHFDGVPACKWYYRFDASFWATIDYGIERPGEFTIRIFTPTYDYTTNAPGYYNPPIQCIGGQLTMAGTVQLASTGGCAPVTFALGAVAPCVAPCTFCNGIQPSMTVSGWIGGCATNNGVYTFTGFVPGSPCTWIWDKIGSPSVIVTFNAGVWTISQPGATAATNSGVSCQSNTIVGTAVANNLPGVCNPPVTPITFSFP